MMRFFSFDGIFDQQGCLFITNHDSIFLSVQIYHPVSPGLPFEIKCAVYRDSIQPCRKQGPPFKLVQSFKRLNKYVLCQIFRIFIVMHIIKDKIENTVLIDSHQTAKS